MDLGLKRDLATVADLRHRVRRLGWFRQSFRQAAAQVGRAHDVTFAVDDRALADAFFGWVEAFAAHKAAAGADRRDFAVFSAGLLLKELIRAAPARVRTPARAAAGRDPARRTDDAPADFWPEGFLYTQYCLSGLAAVVEQDFGEDLSLAPSADDLRTWWSFRENATEVPAIAIAFLDHFVGTVPDWRLPEEASRRAGARAAAAAAAALGH